VGCPPPEGVDVVYPLADSCMAEYDLDGWTAKDLVTPG